MKTYKEIYKELKIKIQKDYTKRKCVDFEIGCIVCQVYLMLSILEDCVYLEKAEKKLLRENER